MVRASNGSKLVQDHAGQRCTLHPSPIVIYAVNHKNIGRLSAPSVTKALRQMLRALIFWGEAQMAVSPAAVFEGATVTVFDGRFGELAAWARAGRACRRACGGQDVAWKAAGTWSDLIS